MNDIERRLAELERRLDNGRYSGPVVKEPPILPYRTIVKDSGDPGYVNRVLIGTATTGLVRIEWVSARYGQIIPANWSMVQMVQYVNAYIPLRYQVAEAQNLIVRAAVQGDFEWLLLIEHDVCLPPDAFKRFNDYMREAQHPVVSGLYYTRSRPAEPLIYRGRGVSFYDRWQMGDLVWCDGVPTGILLVHMGILRAMWEDSEEYILHHPTGERDKLRRVFYTPRDSWYDQDGEQFNASQGTSDLDWCTRVIKEGYLAKAGWHEHQELEYPFVVDTNIFCKHNNMDGEVFP